MVLFRGLEAINDLAGTPLPVDFSPLLRDYSGASLRRLEEWLAARELRYLDFGEDTTDDSLCASATKRLWIRKSTVMQLAPGKGTKVVTNLWIAPATVVTSTISTPKKNESTDEGSKLLRFFLTPAPRRGPQDEPPDSPWLRYEAEDWR